MRRFGLAVPEVAACLLLAAACGESSHSGPDVGLIVEADTTDRIAGTFGAADLEVRFVVTWSATQRRAVVSTGDGIELVDIQIDDTQFVSSVLGGRLVTTIDLALVDESQRIERLPEEDRPPFSPADGVEISGDRGAIAELLATPEYVLLPLLSRQLGEAGYTGVSHPAVLLLHKVGMQAAADLATDPNIDTDVPLPGTLRAETCVDLRSDPAGNESFGMCGPSSSCWEWVCGDCCCHKGCESHDSTCRNCKWYKPWNCLLCISFASFLAGQCAPCDGGGGYNEPACRNIGDSCNEDVDCCSLHDGSDEGYAAPAGVGCIYDVSAGEGRCRDLDGPYCGDGSCDVDEDCDTCANDCGCTGMDQCQGGVCVASCGNDACDNGENCDTCAADCGCPLGEVCATGQCVDPPMTCGDNTCQMGTENCSLCPGDCPCGNGLTCQAGNCVDPGPSCGDNTCQGGVEDCGNCPSDCPCPGNDICQNNQCVDPAPFCGDNSCEPVVEDCGNCPGDCPCPGNDICQNGQCVAPAPFCGDNSCEPVVEDCGNCPGDCPCPGDDICQNGQCVAPAPFCGDNACEPVVEDCGNCPGDCPCPGNDICQSGQCVAPPPVCGDNMCAPGVEDCGNCPGDCPCPTNTSCIANMCQ